MTAAIETSVVFYAIAVWFALVVAVVAFFWAATIRNDVADEMFREPRLPERRIETWARSKLYDWDQEGDFDGHPR